MVFSVLYLPFAEFDNDEWPDGRPEDHYYCDLLEHLDQVETELREQDPQGTRHLLIKREQDLDAVLGGHGLIGFAHGVEGGFHLGAAIAEIDGRVKKLVDRGVVYITLAHLFPRQVAANAPAIPFLPDSLYNRIFPQPPGTGLSDIGRAAVKAMHKHGVLIDISHMREDATEDTFDLVEGLEKDHHKEPSDFPVIATHAGFRFKSDQSYMLSPPTIQRIAKRKGVIGLIMAQHQLNHGLDIDDPEKFAATRKRSAATSTRSTSTRTLSRWSGSGPTSTASSSQPLAGSSAPGTLASSMTLSIMPIPAVPRVCFGATRSVCFARHWPGAA